MRTVAKVKKHWVKQFIIGFETLGLPAKREQLILTFVKIVF